MLLMWSMQQGTADVLVSSGMAAATGLGSAAGRLTTKMAHAPPPPPYHRLVHCRGIHSRRTSPDPIPSTPRKVNHALFCSILFILLPPAPDPSLIRRWYDLFVSSFRFPHSLRIYLMWLALRWLVPRFSCIFGSGHIWTRSQPCMRISLRKPARSLAISRIWTPLQVGYIKISFFFVMFEIWASLRLRQHN